MERFHPLLLNPPGQLLRCDFSNGLPRQSLKLRKHPELLEPLTNPNDFPSLRRHERFRRLAGDFVTLWKRLRY